MNRNPSYTIADLGPLGRVLEFTAPGGMFPDGYLGHDKELMYPKKEECYCECCGQCQDD